MLAQMGGLAEDQLANAVDALAKRDIESRRPGHRRTTTRSMRSKLAIEEKAILTIAKRQPMARDLREIMVAIRIASDLERIGDLAKNHRQARPCHSRHLAAPPVGRRHPHGQAWRSSSSRTSSMPMPRGTTPRQSQVWRSDEEIDALYNSIFRELLTYMMEDPRMIGVCTHLLFGAKNLERIGDHATNIAENIHYLVHGRPIGEERPEEGHDQLHDL